MKDAKGKDMFNAVSTTGWNDPELLKRMAAGMDRESKWEIPGVPHGSQNRPPFLQRTGD